MKLDGVELREPITLLGKPTTTVVAKDVDNLELSETRQALIVSKYPETHWVPWSNVKSGWTVEHAPTEEERRAAADTKVITKRGKK